MTNSLHIKKKFATIVTPYCHIFVISTPKMIKNMDLGSNKKILELQIHASFLSHRKGDHQKSKVTNKHTRGFPLHLLSRELLSPNV